MLLIEFFAATILVALWVSFVYLTFRKYGLWEYLQIHADGWLERITKRRSERLNEFFSCVYCCALLLGFVTALILVVATGDFYYIATAFLSVPLVRRWT